MVWTHLKNISQIGWSTQVGVKIKNVGNYHVAGVMSAPQSQFMQQHTTSLIPLMIACDVLLSEGYSIHLLIPSFCFQGFFDIDPKKVGHLQAEAPLTNTCCLCLNRGNPTCLKKMVGFSNAPTKNGGFMCVMTCNFWLDNSVAPWLQAPQKTNGLRGTWSLLAYLTSQNASFQPSLEEVL